MAKGNKDGFFKRLLGGKKNGDCCSVKIIEIKEESKDDRVKQKPQAGDCKQVEES
ncbi:MAG: hypothetical protein JSV50_15355 [Desulfobacteraceae bacterium]|nr:MAG: hypothetical protein JSV50_15355 [Desulfobacteraceae bacterium]